MQTQQTQRLALEQRLAELDTTHQQEITHAQAAADQLSADLAAARSRLSVRVNPATCASSLPAAPSAAGVDDAAGARADLHPATAAGVIRVTARADQCRARLTALQAWVREVANPPDGL
ncbi:lysis system i-spanin subunit Rz [Pseudomonas xionganensis]|uniref:lysis system i-spanin subunit Rz n=1 Tax=Pseudomonas xionganensis TaxID=2654845 RepID=UPI003899E021